MIKQVFTWPMAAFHLNCKSEFPDPFNFPFLYSNLLFLLFTLFFPGYSFQDSTPFHWFLYPASPLLYPNPLYLLQFNLLPPVYSTSSPSTRHGSTPFLDTTSIFMLLPTTLIIVFIWRSYWRIIHSAWQLHYMITTVKHNFINLLWIPPYRQQFS